MIDGRHITYYEDDDATNLSTEQQSLLQKHREIVEARKKEQEAQKAESERLDEILRICEEYAKQQVVVDGTDEEEGKGADVAVVCVAAKETDDSVDNAKASKVSSTTQQPTSPQSPPPLNKPGRKAYGLGLLSNASVEASKEIIRTGKNILLNVMFVN